MSSGITGQIDYFNSLVGKQINNAYLIEDRIAVGGMGAVFRGRRNKQGDSVAIKVISPHLATNPVFVKRFQREARVGWALSHPNIVKVYEFGETEDGLLFMVMEFVEGETLSDYLERSGPLTVHRSLELIKPLCEALDVAHGRTVLHRDLKPANIMIAKDLAGRETIKLTDFGLAKLLQPDEEITQGSNLTEVGEACGTPFYMSPEQIIGQTLNPTSDIYSLGVILYQMLTAKMPIEGTSVRQILALKIKHDVQPPSIKFPFLPSTLDKVLQKALERDPKKRYQTAGELLQSFEMSVAQITNEFSQATEPSIDKNLLADVRNSINSPAASSYTDSAPTGPLTSIPSASYFESPPTGPLIAPPATETVAPPVKTRAAPAPAETAPHFVPEPVPAPPSQNKLLMAVIALLAIIAILLAVLLFTQK